MKWICNYCLKVIEKDNFIDALEESMDDEYHAWRRGIDNKIKSNPTIQDQGLLNRLHE